MRNRCFLDSKPWLDALHFAFYYSPNDWITCEQASIPPIERVNEIKKQFFIPHLLDISHSNKALKATVLSDIHNLPDYFWTKEEKNSWDFCVFYYNELFLIPTKKFLDIKRNPTKLEVAFPSDYLPFLSNILFFMEPI